MKILKTIAIATIITASSLVAHSLWVNTFESFSHKPGHVMTGIGWGDAFPIDDILDSKITIQSFNLIDPKLKKVALQIPSKETGEVLISNDDIKILNADLAMQKIAFTEDTPKGVYQIEVQTKPSFFTKYIDKDGKKRLKLKPKDELKNVKKILFSMKHQAFAKSYFTLDKWSEPKPLGHGLEIIPKTDLSKVKVGDLVELEVLFNGKPLTSSPVNKEYLLASSKAFGQSDGNFLFSYIYKGKVKIRVKSSGQWILSVNHKEVITKNGKLKELYSKTDVLSNIATLTFSVQ